MFEFLLYIKNIQKSFRGHMQNKKENLEKLNNEWEREVNKLIDLELRTSSKAITNDLP